MKFLDYEKLGLISEALARQEVGDKVLTGRVEAYSCKPAGDDKKLMKELGSAWKEEGLSMQGAGTTHVHSHSHHHTPSSASGGSGVATAGASSSSLQPAGYHHHPHFRIHEQPPSHQHSFLLGGSAGGMRPHHNHTPPTGSGLRYGSVPAHLPSAAHHGFSMLSAATSSPLGDLTDPGTRKLLVQLIATMNAAFPDYDFSGVRPEQFLREPDLRLVVSDVHRHLFELCDLVSPTFLEELWAAVDEAATLRECEIYSYLPDMEGDPFSDGNLWSFNYFFVNRKAKRIVFFTCIAKSKFQKLLEEREAALMEGGNSGESDGNGNGASDLEEQYWVDDL